VVRVFANQASCLHLVRALCAETHEAWLEDNRYINMDLFNEQWKAAMKIAA
jgi:putative transposase